MAGIMSEIPGRKDSRRVIKGARRLLMMGLRPPKMAPGRSPKATEIAGVNPTSHLSRGKEEKKDKRKKEVKTNVKTKINENEQKHAYRIGILVLYSYLNTASVVTIFEHFAVRNCSKGEKLRKPICPIMKGKVLMDA